MKNCSEITFSMSLFALNVYKKPSSDLARHQIASASDLSMSRTAKLQTTLLLVTFVGQATSEPLPILEKGDTIIYSLSLQLALCVIQVTLGSMELDC